MSEHRPVGKIEQLTQETESKQPIQTEAKFPTFQEIINLPEPEETTETREFAFRVGATVLTYSFTIRTDGRTSAERYALLTEQFGKAVHEDAFKFRLPTGKQIEVKSTGHLTNLYLMAEVCVNPKWNAESWAVFGHKIGKDIDEVFDWSVRANGVDEFVFKLLQAQAKNASGQDGTFDTPKSSGPASASANVRRKRPSRANR